MVSNAKRGKWIWGLTVLVIAGLACSFGTPQGNGEATPEVVTIVVTATEPRPTESSADTASAIAIFKQDLNVRSGPSTTYSIKDQLPGGTTVPIIGRNQGGTWWLISYKGYTGWVSAPYVESSNTKSVPVVDAPSSSGGSSSGGSGGSSGGGSGGSSSGGVSGGSSGGGSSSGGSSGGGGGGSSAPGDSDITASVSIKNGNATFHGEVSYPNGDTTDNVYIKPSGFDSVKTSGNLIFTLTCSGGTAKVNYNGGSVKNGSPGCNKTWTVFVTNVSADSRVKIYLDSSGHVNWNLVVSGGG